jgi:hypothetical protein
VSADLLVPVRRVPAPPHPAAPAATPGSVVRRYAAVGATALLLGAVHVPHRPATLCLFRELTGLPCPFCGGTTAAVRLGHGQLEGALAASPLAVAVLATWPLLGVMRPPRWWRQRSVRWTLVAAILGFAEIWQLARFGVIHL